MKRPINTLAFALAIITTPLMARTWTSADGSKTFEGDYVSKEASKVTVKMKSGETMTFPISKLSEADQAFVTEQKESAVSGTKMANTEQPIYSQVSKYLRKFSKSSYKKAELATVPEYYILYFSASW